VHVGAPLDVPGLSVVVGRIGSNASDLHKAWHAIRLRLDHHNGIEPEQAQVGEVILGEPLCPQVRVDEPNAAKPSGTCAVSLQIGNK
jgi:hypothetical protein